MASNLEPSDYGIFGGIVASLLAGLAYVGRWLIRTLDERGEENTKRIASLEEKVEESQGHERECLKRVAELERRCGACALSRVE
jgi:hypothetical protein